MSKEQKGTQARFIKKFIRESTATTLLPLYEEFKETVENTLYHLNDKVEEEAEMKEHLEECDDHSEECEFYEDITFDDIQELDGDLHVYEAFEAYIQSKKEMGEL